MWPDAVQYDPVRNTASQAIEALLEGPGSAGPVVLLAVGPVAQQSGWAGATAVALADAFTARGESVILADLSLQNPELHARLGTDNEEGLTDVFLFGASLQHVTRPIAGKWFRLIPASPFTPDPRVVMRHLRWSNVFEELALTRSKLVVYLPMDVPGATVLADRFGHTIVLAAPVDLPLVADAISFDADVIGVLEPPEAAPKTVTEVVTKTVTDTGLEIEIVTEIDREPPAAAPAEPAAPASIERVQDGEFEKIRIPKDSAREALIADLRARQRAALTAPPPEMVPLTTEESVSAADRLAVMHARQPGTHKAEPLFVRPAVEPVPKPTRGWFTWVLLLVLAAAFGAAAWYVWTTQFSGVGEPQPLRDRGPAQLSGGAVAGDVPLPYSVAIASYEELNLAEERLNQLITQEPQLSFYIGPIEIQGTLYYRVIAGPVADRVAAMALRDTLVAKGIRTVTTGWEVLDTPFAFFLGEYAERREAEAQKQQAATKGVPSYIVASTGQNGARQYTLYAGAYTGVGDAEVMRQILIGVGMPDNLVERTGSNRS